MGFTNSPYLILVFFSKYNFFIEIFIKLIIFKTKGKRTIY